MTQQAIYIRIIKTGEIMVLPTHIRHAERMVAAGQWAWVASDYITEPDHLRVVRRPEHQQIAERISGTKVALVWWKNQAPSRYVFPAHLYQGNGNVMYQPICL